MTSVRRSLVRVLVTVVALAVILVAADLGARSYVLGRVAQGIADEYGLDTRPEVSVAGGSFLVQVARGGFEDATLRVEDFPAGDLTLSDVRVRIPEVDVPTGVLLGGSGTVDLGAGTVRALADFGSLSEQVSAASPVEIALERSGDDVRASTTVSVLGFDLELALSVEPRLQDGGVRLVPVAAELGGREVPLSRARDLLSAAGFSLLDGWTVGLDDVPAQIDVQSLDVTDAGIEVRGASLATSIELG